MCACEIHNKKVHKMSVNIFRNHLEYIAYIYACLYLTLCGKFSLRNVVYICIAWSIFIDPQMNVEPEQLPTQFR